MYECVKELEREREREERSSEVSKWEKGKRSGNNKGGVKGKERERGDCAENNGKNQRQRKERKKKIEESKYNDLYKNIMTEEESTYLLGRGRRRR